MVVVERGLTGAHINRHEPNHICVLQGGRMRCSHVYHRGLSSAMLGTAALLPLGAS